MGNLGGFFEFLEKNYNTEYCELVDKLRDLGYTDIVVDSVGDCVWFEQVVSGDKNELS